MKTVVDMLNQIEKMGYSPPQAVATAPPLDRPGNDGVACGLVLEDP